jgi:hypothetical protein
MQKTGFIAALLPLVLTAISFHKPAFAGAAASTLSLDKVVKF